jgi:hypothetical protein
MLWTMSDREMQAGIEAFRRGDKRRVRRIFSQIARDDPDNAAAWWYLAAVLDEPEQQITCLEHVLRLRPDHEEAQNMLRAVKLRLGTPADGTTRPVFEVEEAPDGSVHVTTADMKRPDLSLEAEEPPSDMSRVTLVMFVALLAIAAAIMLVVLGRFPGIATGEGIEEPQPTAILLEFGLEACTTTDDNTTSLVFINNSPVTIDLLTGPTGEEELVATIATQAKSVVEIEPETRVRYLIVPDDADYSGSGAYFEVDAGNSCRVPVH